ncbi:hypothetical protein DENSPDRAFT_840241 [Dentipellis sp. KUC8613]|nr:hypothetical protein DENSPDRAFT_840241 [Dentipellis sp. KUC8613]
MPILARCIPLASLGAPSLTVCMCACRSELIAVAFQPTLILLEHWHSRIAISSIPYAIGEASASGVSPVSW